MKKVSLLFGFVFTAILFTACSKNYTVINPPNHDHWLTQERGDVVYSDASCDYYVVESDFGYTVIRAIAGAMPYETDILFGDFGRYGNRQFYNYTTDYLISGQVVEYDLSYSEAQEALDYYCPVYYNKKSVATQSRIKNSGLVKSKRPVAAQ